MFETDKFDATLAGDAVTAPHVPLLPPLNVARASFLWWGEHCVECAAPSCFATCDLYQPRIDGQCRRFAFGVYRNRSFDTRRGYGAEVRFKRWAKLEARGNTRIWPWGSLRWFERFMGAALPASRVLGNVAWRLTGKARWRRASVAFGEKVARRLQRTTGDLRPDGFLLEVFNPSMVPFRLQLSMTIARKELPEITQARSLPTPFITSFELHPGASRHFVPLADFSHVTDSGLPFDIMLMPEQEEGAHLVFLMADFVQLAEPIAREHEAASATEEGPGIKCVVWDLDNTLWDGLLVEGGEVHLRDDLVEIIRQLDQRGILCSVASKNDPEMAARKLADFGVAEFFLVPQVSWGPKSQGVRAIAAKLNIGLDTFAFIDDNEFELQEVGRALPEVLCLPVSIAGSILGAPRFAGSTSVEARQRRQLYREAGAREQAQEEFADDYTAFLKSCGIVLRVAPFADADLERVSELVQRTNQLNFSGRKYSREQVAEVIHDSALEKYVCRCEDRFGSHGTVGFGVVHREGARIEVRDFMLSCRVQGRFIEQAFFKHLVDVHPGGHAEALVVNYQPTARNRPALQVMEELGFERLPSSVGMSLDLVARPLSCDFIQVIAS